MLEDVPPILIWAIPLFIGAMVLEAVDAARDDADTYADIADARTSITMGLGYLAIVGLFWKTVTLAAMFAVWEFRLFDLGWGWQAWVAVLFLDDFAYYWYHRAHHEIRVLWASHVVHHSSQRYNLSTALRQTWTPYTGLLFWVWLPLVGIHPILVLTSQSINLLYQFWIHTERIDKLHPSFEYVFNTPSHHRVHHGSQAQYLDRNYGGILILWDRWFGTFEPESEPVRYGLTTNIETYNPLRVAFHEWAAIWRDVRRPGLTPRQRAGMALAGPGYAAALTAQDQAPATA
jgi:sterol desaturase/sphingolipid hydroxylase (fatty acid hydroxylase superfamily)